MSNSSLEGDMIQKPKGAMGFAQPHLLVFSFARITLFSGYSQPPEVKLEVLDYQLVQVKALHSWDNASSPSGPAVHSGGIHMP
jgi:hypothetical protein